MERANKLELIKSKVSNRNLIKHMLATEFVMEALAERLNGEKQIWADAGLMHDIDYQLTAEDPTEHGMVGAELLTEEGFTADICRAVKLHGRSSPPPAEDQISRALYSADAVTGLIVAAALIHPEKKLSAIDLEFVAKRFEEKRFAAGADRGQIAAIEGLGIELKEFLELALKAMQSRSAELGL